MTKPDRAARVALRLIYDLICADAPCDVAMPTFKEWAKLQGNRADAAHIRSVILREVKRAVEEERGECIDAAIQADATIELDMSELCCQVAAEAMREGVIAAIRARGRK